MGVLMSNDKINYKKWITLIVLILGGGTIYKLASIKDAFYVPLQTELGLNSSTTNLEIAKLIKNKNKLSKLTVLTNSVLIANELIQNSNCSVFLTGGFFKRDEFSLAGPLATNNISQFFVDIAFISVSGISLRAGITDYDMDELPVQKEMISIAQKVIILADSSKFCSRSLLKVTDLDKANAIITDSNLEESVYQEFLSNGINLIKQEPNQTSPPTTRRAK
jgi:DeoR family fructose operon transcriptional repressor